MKINSEKLIQLITEETQLMDRNDGFLTSQFAIGEVNGKQIILKITQDEEERLVCGSDCPFRCIE